MKRCLNRAYLGGENAPQISPATIFACVRNCPSAQATSSVVKRPLSQFVTASSARRQSKFPQPQTLTFCTGANSRARLIQAPQPQYGGRTSQSGWLSKETSTNGLV